jgi:hypothetical protein
MSARWIFLDPSIWSSADRSRCVLQTGCGGMSANGPSRHFAATQHFGRSRREADINWRVGPAGSVAIDPKSRRAQHQRHAPQDAQQLPQPYPQPAYPQPQPPHHKPPRPSPSPSPTQPPPQPRQPPHPRQPKPTPPPQPRKPPQPPQPRQPAQPPRANCTPPPMFSLSKT